MASATKQVKHGKRHRRILQVEEAAPVEVFDCKNVNHLNKLPGLKRIEMSPLTQKFVGCRVGENITTEIPWVFVEKEKIEDHLEFYEEHSEFFPIMADIRQVPKEQILMGTYHYSQEDNIEFYVCVTKEAEQLISEEVEKQQKALHDKIMNSFHPKSRKWTSLGSEIQVDCEISKNMRPLVAIDLEGCMPLQKQKVRFAIRNVENLLYGYAELVTTRTTINSIMRKRLDLGIQSSPIKKNVAVQAMSPGQCNKSIQYSVAFRPVNLTATLLEILHQFVKKKLLEIGDVLKLNFSLDLYYNDYKNLGNSLPLQILEESTEIKSYQDVINCRRRKISCFTWNAIFSGIVAAAHASTPIFCVENQKSSLDVEYDTVFAPHLVLIWHYSDNVQPLLYLHASRDVTAISFCPYDANILVAGYNNGQIAVWDLTNKLDSQETREFLTDVEQKNHLLIANETTWFQHPLADNHVFPVLCCSLEDGHSGTVTTIQWIPPSKYIAPQRAYKESDEGEPHMQFITASIDGYRILIWDLFISSDLKAMTSKKKCARLSAKPEALLRNISPLAALKKSFRPVCQLIMKQLSYPITSILVQNQMYSYVPENSQTLNDIDQLTYFKVSENSAPFNYSTKLLFTTGIGTFHEATWEPSDYDPKYFAVDERCQTEKFFDVHDGPILVCEACPCLQDVILTIGGSVFAIWFLREIKVPVFWRKHKERYITGMWCRLHPLSILTVRNDTHYEIWNIFERSELPLQIFRYKGNRLTKLYKDTTRSHVRKKTCVVTDTVGAFKIYTVPSETMNVDLNIEEAMDYLYHMIKIKENVTKVKENFCRNQKASAPKVEPPKEEEGPVKFVAEEPVAKEVVAPLLTQKMKFQMKMERNMRKVLYEKKKINLSEIEQNRNVLQKIVADSHAKENNVTLKKSQRDAIFKKEKDNLIVTETIKPPRQEKTYKYDTKAVKESFLNDYKNMEEEVVNEIKNNKYCFQFNWPKVLMHHKERYKIERLKLML